MHPFLTLALAALLLLLRPPSAPAFQAEAGPAKECVECHSLTPAEANRILEGAVDNVVGVVPGPVRGIWEVDVEKDGKVYPLYLDYSGRYLFHGQVIRMSDRENLSMRRFQELNRIDVSSIPLDDAVVIGDPGAGKRVIVFDDPDCAWCRRLHGEIRQVVARDPGVAFFIRVYSRNGNPETARKALSIVCGKKDSAKRLEDAFAGKTLPAPDCNSDAVKVTERVAALLGIEGTPAMVLPDGRLVNGFLTADALLKMLDD